MTLPCAGRPFPPALTGNGVRLFDTVVSPTQLVIVGSITVWARTNGLVLAAGATALAVLVSRVSPLDAFRLPLVPIYVILALSLNSLMSTTGQVSLAHVGLLGVGASMLLDTFRATLDAGGKNLTRASFDKAMVKFKYDNGYLNPVDFAGTQVGGVGMVVLWADAKAGVPVEIDSDWPSSFKS